LSAVAREPDGAKPSNQTGDRDVVQDSVKSEKSSGIATAAGADTDDSEDDYNEGLSAETVDAVHLKFDAEAAELLPMVIR